MKVGDLVTMPGETLRPGQKPSVGIIVADDYQTRNQRRKNSRIGVMWSDSLRSIDYEPKAWLEVISESR